MQAPARPDLLACRVATAGVSPRIVCDLSTPVFHLSLSASTPTGAFSLTGWWLNITGTQWGAWLVAVGERAQAEAPSVEGARTSPNNSTHAAAPEQVEVVDGVRARQHPADHAGPSSPRCSARAPTAHQRGPRSRRTRPSAAPGPEPVDRHQVRIIEDRSNRVRRFHLRGAPPGGGRSRRRNPDPPCSGGHSRSTPRAPHRHRPVDQG